jgi:dephospho-CoA kinase
VQVIGLTGGIATGKSSVSAILKKAGAVIIDADRIVRDVVKKGLPAYREIIDTFGDKILAPDDEIDRSVLGDIIFKNRQQKQLLNRIVRPFILTLTVKKISLRFSHILTPFWRLVPCRWSLAVCLRISQQQEARSKKPKIRQRLAY